MWIKSFAFIFVIGHLSAKVKYISFDGDPSLDTSFVCEWVYIIVLLQHWSNSEARSLKELQKHRPVTSTCISGLYLIIIRGGILGGIIVQVRYITCRFQLHVQCGIWMDIVTHIISKQLVVVVFRIVLELQPE